RHRMQNFNEQSLSYPTEQKHRPFDKEISLNANNFISLSNTQLGPTNLSMDFQGDEENKNSARTFPRATQNGWNLREYLRPAHSQIPEKLYADPHLLIPSEKTQIEPYSNINEIPQINYVTKVVEIPQYVYKHKIQEVPTIVPFFDTVECEKIIYKDKIIEVPRIVERHVPVEKLVEVPVIKEIVKFKCIEVPQKIVRVFPVDKYVDVRKQKVYNNAICCQSRLTNISCCKSLFFVMTILLKNKMYFLFQIKEKIVKVQIPRYQERLKFMPITIPRYRQVRIEKKIPRPLLIFQPQDIYRDVEIPKIITKYARTKKALQQSSTGQMLPEISDIPFNQCNGMYISPSHTFK
ncbi:hypothetical protein IE077_001991, partial [Cardiosporidium cionae]